jgi:type II restriction enzyme
MDVIETLLRRWTEDPSGSYRTWFLWNERLKNFRSIRRGLSVVVEEIRSDRFGRQYRGSSLETVVRSVAEQRQLFKGADHAFLWKPKLRIPDIYENRENQIAFADFLDACACCDSDTEVLAAIHRIDARRIKGLGPAAANLLYFLHPTIAPPFNTAIARGFQRLTGIRVPLGSWPAYLAFRDGLLRLNEQYRQYLSNDLGAIAGFVYDIGTARYPAPPLGFPDASDDAMTRWRDALAVAVLEAGAARHSVSDAEELTHTGMQGWLRDLGRALGFTVWIASNDRGRAYEGGRLGDGCLSELPSPYCDGPGADAIHLIDVLWLDQGKTTVAAFEIEHTTSIYSGIVRLLDLALGAGAGIAHDLFLVAPDARESDVRAQLARPAFQRIGDLHVRFLPYSALAEHRLSMARFGSGLKAIEAVSRQL